MSKKIVILTIPGIGTKEVGYSTELEKDIRRFTNNQVKPNLKVLETLPFNATEVDRNQNELFRRLDAANKLGGKLSLRKFVIEAFGDGVTFERDAGSPNSNYKKIHQYLKGEIENANALLKEGDIFVILAASMGVHLLSTYIWDADNGKGIFADEAAKEGQNLKNLDYLATIGCNIPLFVSGLRESQIIAFNKRNDHFEWDNYYDRDDVLGWPLKQMSDSYDALVNDHEINTGQYVGSHVKYWDDNDFTKPFSEKLNTIYAEQ
ncbi:MAG: hypothetical protein ACJA1C_002853 [Crocinitomicaceae bacterium]|jgi:hypothetical protein